MSVGGTAQVIKGGAHVPQLHDSAHKHVSGEALYVDDLPEPPGLLFAAFGMSERAHARIVKLDLEPVRQAPGVVAVIAVADVPGKNDVGPVVEDEPIFAEELVQCVGQSIFAVAAESAEQAWRAARLAHIEYEDLDPVLTIDEAMAKGSFVLPPHQMQRGDARAAIDAAPRRLEGRIEIGGQDHFYLEGQVSLALPLEDGDLLVHCSTQHPSEVQHAVAQALGRADNSVTVEVRRMGGAFGGKETQAALFAIIAGLLADKTGRPVKARVDRDDDMVMTGKRHEFRIDYEVGFDNDGRITGIVFEQAGRCGFSADLSGAICDRAMFHADNCYYLDNVTIISHRCKTHTVSNTAFRGFGGPQGMVGIEQVIDEIARDLDRDPLDVRRVNFYGIDERNVTPYHMTIEDNIVGEIVDALEESSGYRARRREIEAFNATNPVLKRGLALTPVKFGISFTTTFLNQAGALVHVYSDGSVHLNHGGTEMGQGLFTKVAQIVAEVFQVDVDRIKITATNTGKVPNTSATAASSGTDINGAAAQIAAGKIRDRMAAVAAKRFGVEPEEIVFAANRVRGGEHSISFVELARTAYLERVQLSATGFFRTPKIHYDRDSASGRPFRYFAYGAAVSEVVIDTLTGENKLLRVDILHDCGKSLNPAIDLGQVEGGFVQGMGWLTMEELWWNRDGVLMTHAPSTYKIPVSGDVPAEFHTRLLESGRNREDVVHRSKAVGEPPLMLAISVFLAIKHAIASVCDYRLSPRLDAPATAERILMTIEDLKARVGTRGGKTEAAE
jgi:xanthine dehydrogenase large subunit